MNYPYYSKEFWIHTLDKNGPEYKSFIFFENLGKSTVLPAGFKVQLGVGNGYTLNAMKQFWGEDSVLGIDLYNFNNDPNVYTVDIKKLKLQLPCSYIENDIGSTSYPEAKEDRWHATQWAIKCLMPGGIFITSLDHMIGYPVKEYAQKNNCQVVEMTDYDNESWAIYLNEQTPWKTTGWCIIKKLGEQE